MKKRLAISMFVILFVAAAMGGATMAWFSDQVTVEPNVFTAGTVELDAFDSWESDDFSVDTWNPGDCTPKFIDISYIGNKRAFMRMQITGEWDDEELDGDNVSWKTYVGESDYGDLYDGDTGEWNIPDGYDDLSAWFNDDSEWEALVWDDGIGSHDFSDEWVYYDGWWYYAQGSDSDTTITKGEGEDAITINAIDPDVDDVEGINIIGAVCLDGAGTGNEYQGKLYTINANFEAIQASHAGEWVWDEVIEQNH